ncbi:MAG: hypothetical protein LBU55_03190 [Elusimicrobiota bacterium]|jgi:hypothetical protein|nr:hypothetical protein [Elusimicrobiota bacterium]
MPNYLNIQNEETLKAQVFQDYFDKTKFSYEPNIGNIDFIVTDSKLAKDGLSKMHYLWAEAKKGEADEASMMTQLVLTCKKTYDSGEFLPPPYLGCFDGKKIGFLPFYDILSIFSENDINWNTAPSNYLSDDFIKTKKKIAKLLAKNFVVYNFDADRVEIKEFIKMHFTNNATASIKSPITKNNFPHIYNRWVTEVKPAINITPERWQKYKKEGVLDLDFFLADIMSRDGQTITQKLNIVLENDNYRLRRDIEGELFKTDINFTDAGTAYKRFWNKYERPPAEEYQQYIIGRRDLLVPQNIREIKGSFFTPKIWSDKSKEYIAKSLGESWQKEYAIWDCAAGTGNLLAGLKNKYNIWASTIDQPDVDAMKAQADEKLNLLTDHIFQFDFLNDSFDKLPEGLRNIIDDPEKRKKLIVYINPPYAEATSATTITGTRTNKSQVSTRHSVHAEYKESLGKAGNEIYALFFMRVIHKLGGAYLAAFSTPKYINSENFKKFRALFSAKFQNGFICRADTFDNVVGKFPIVFIIWQLSHNGYDFKFPKTLKLDVLDNAGKHIEKKLFYNGEKSINKWIKEFDCTARDPIGFMSNPGTDFLSTNQPYIAVTRGTRHFNYFTITEKNLIEGCIYFAVRLCIASSWLNNRDQFLCPANDNYKNDIEFQHDCLAFTLFCGQNRISSQHGVNHWIPFTEQAVNSKERFESNFMSNYLKNKTFTPRSQSVFDAGLDLWKYFHAKIKNNKTASVDASFYDIREFFQGRLPNGKMNSKSTDETYSKLIKTLRENLKLLSQKIEPKVYEYGFLR